MSFNTMCENKILAKNFVFTVFSLISPLNGKYIYLSIASLNQVTFGRGFPVMGQ